MIINGDSLTELANIPDNTIDSIVTDPPYELGFMGKKWDNTGIAYNVELWEQCLRVLKPGGHLLAFGGTRTYHRMAVAIEDAGFEIRDSIHWLYGSGFPKSMDVSKAIDKAAGAEREVVGSRPLTGNGKTMKSGFHQPDGSGAGETVKQDVFDITTPATDAAKQWSGWGTALKPAHEPIVVARKPLVGTVAGNVLAHGTGALNIDGCRVGLVAGEANPSIARYQSTAQDGNNGWQHVNRGGNFDETTAASMAAGRWPANLVFTHAADCADVCVDGCPVAELDTQSGVRTSGLMKAGTKTRGYDGPSMGEWKPGKVRNDTYADTGGASRFFTNTEWDPIADITPFHYTPKPSKKERNAGLDGMPEVTTRQGMGGTMPVDDRGVERDRFQVTQQNFHPTVKPVALMRWLVRLVTPPGGTVLDPFTGSGTTLVAATLEGFNYIGIELTKEYLPIIEARTKWAKEQTQNQQPTLDI
jgi:DNA modification methylase